MTKHSGFIRPYQSKISWAYRLGDVLLVVLALYVSCWVFGAPWKAHYELAAFVGVVLLVLFSAQNDLYRSWRLFRLHKEILQLFSVWAYVVVGLLLIAFMTKSTIDYSRLVISTWFIVAPVFMSLYRYILRKVLYKLRENGWNTRATAIVGANEQGVRFAKNLDNARWMGMRFIGFYDDREIDRIHVGGIDEIKGNLDELIVQAKSGEIDTIYLTMPLKAESRAQELIARLADTTVSLYYVPDFSSLDILSGSWMTLGDSAVVSVFENPYFGVDGWLKRVEDVVLASCVLVVIALPMIAIAIAVKVTSPGPVIFKQRRYGINGQEIEVWKFRSMTTCDDDINDIQQAQRNDARITKLGEFLRKSSLDELPQFLNVLKGEMSIVGPRPHAVAHNELYRAEIHRYMMRHKVKPGITGWAQINGWRGETESKDKMEKRIEYDLDYIRNWSLYFDLKIFCLTLIKGFINKNAY